VDGIRRDPPNDGLNSLDGQQVRSILGGDGNSVVTARAEIDGQDVGRKQRNEAEVGDFIVGRLEVVKGLLESVEALEFDFDDADLGILRTGL
jgi:hypothetical protein